MQTVECVPNFSEGRTGWIIDSIVRSVAEVPGVKVLHVDSGAATNRTVLTFVGPPGACLESAFQLIARAAELIDMRNHEGVHPRQGATDVLPFVPLEGLTLDECARLARELAKRVGDELGIPVYLYEQAASSPERRNLAFLRKGQYEALPQKLSDPDFKPDFGPDQWNERVARTGVVTIGARDILVAYNINLGLRDPRSAKELALLIRERGHAKRVGVLGADYFQRPRQRYRISAKSLPCGLCDLELQSLEGLEAHTLESHGRNLDELLAQVGQERHQLEGRLVKRPGPFRHLKADGWYIAEYDRAQLTMNLTNPRVTPPHLVFEKAGELATLMGIDLTGSELVGLIPSFALLDAGRFYQARLGIEAELCEKELLELAVRSMKLDDLAPFDIESRVLTVPNRSR